MLIVWKKNSRNVGSGSARLRETTRSASHRGATKPRVPPPPLPLASIPRLRPRPGSVAETVLQVFCFRPSSTKDVLTPFFWVRVNKQKHEHYYNCRENVINLEIPNMKKKMCLFGRFGNTIRVRVLLVRLHPKTLLSLDNKTRTRSKTRISKNNKSQQASNVWYALTNPFYGYNWNWDNYQLSRIKSIKKRIRV